MPTGRQYLVGAMIVVPIFALICAFFGWRHSRDTLVPILWFVGSLVAGTVVAGVIGRQFYR